MTIDQTVEKLTKSRDAYYNGTPVMTDAEFDDLEEALYDMDPNNPYFDLVGIATTGNKIKHEHPMLSMNKGKSVEDVTKWLNKITNKRLELLGMPKLDGLSGSLIYEDGELETIATRGDGKEGQDITHIKDYIDVPKTIPFLKKMAQKRVEIRGELYISKESNFPNPEGNPLRNLAVGLINRKDTGLDDLKYISFTGYQAIGFAYKTEESKLDFIKDCDIDVVEHKIMYSMTELENWFIEYKEQLREDWKYETDGLVITVNDCSLHDEINSKYVVSRYNHYNIALKPPSEIKKSKLINIEWNVSKNGCIIPKAIFEPVTIMGREIKQSSLSNYENVLKMKLEIGDELLVSLSNDVIPYVEENITKGVKQR